MWDVAVIGAGLSGLTCAQQLRAAGYRVCILDKSRGLGGRMATRRVNDCPVDHGLRYWQPQTSALQAVTDELLAAGVLRHWPVSAYEIRQREVLMPIEIDPLYVAPTGMNAIAKHLAQSFLADAPTLLNNHRALALSYLSDHWKIECSKGAVVLARRCVIAIPAPQAADLLSTCEANHPQLATLSSAIAHLKAVEYHPCLTVLAGYDSSCLSQMKPLDTDGWMVTDRVGTSTDWIGLDSSKRDRVNGQTNSPVVVIHSKPAFALRYLEAGDLQPGASVLLRANARKLGEWLAQPEWFQIHRWRYARVKVAHPEAALTMGQSLVCGGDWCIPPGQVEQSIDSAYRSGLAMAQVLLS
jgi:hypothetical protein